MGKRGARKGRADKWGRKKTGAVVSIRAVHEPAATDETIRLTKSRYFQKNGGHEQNFGHEKTGEGAGFLMRVFSIGVILEVFRSKGRAVGTVGHVPRFVPWSEFDLAALPDRDAVLGFACTFLEAHLVEHLKDGIVREILFAMEGVGGEEFLDAPGVLRRFERSGQDAVFLRKGADLFAFIARETASDKERLRVFVTVEPLVGECRAF